LESNERNKADASLIGTYWRIVRMHDKEIAGERGFREPHILLRDVDGRLGYSATVGCNRMLGGIKLDRDAISFEPGATTLMACPPPLDDLERSLRNLLTDARRWCVLGNTLEFFDEEGSSIALLEATFL
jgi:putative lipoprotein